ncbi:MAG: hypothetical protein SFV17_26765 [Candidatus Obscuribacter sp.]|nr:hypothetical protein [Candidatus Melainabacteria bacterium]MDX1990324.1 hypothetical protein [Candidatus Obscuribacter sp.]
MENGVDKFNLSEVLQQVGNAAYSVSCHIIFDLAVHGLAIALFMLTIGLILASMRHRLSGPFLVVGRKLGLVCSIGAVPGVVTLLSSHSLPPVGVYNINSLGYICLWSLITAHMLGEETNYQWTVKKDSPVKPTEQAGGEAPVEAETSLAAQPSESENVPVGR